MTVSRSQWKSGLRPQMLRSSFSIYSLVERPSQWAPIVSRRALQPVLKKINWATKLIRYKCKKNIQVIQYLRQAKPTRCPCLQPSCISNIFDPTEFRCCKHQRSTDGEQNNHRLTKCFHYNRGKSDCLRCCKTLVKRRQQSLAQA